MKSFKGLSGATVFALLGATYALAGGANDHSHNETNTAEMLKSMEAIHEDHEHGHDFAVMDEISEEDIHRTMDFLADVGLVVPNIDSQKGATAYMEKGCIICHSINGVGGEVGPSFNAADMPQPMNAFEFAARMWRGAPAMMQMQEDLLGEMISLDGQELADIVGFVHDQEAQSQITVADIPVEFREMLK